MHTTRRRFLGTGLAAAASVAALPKVPSFATSPNGRLQVGFVGVAGRGAANLGAISSEPTVDVVALCDVDARNLEKAAQAHSAAQTFRDFRKMLETLGDKLDAVVVSTPDHTHAPAAAMAMRMGKHCYCEKPLAHEVAEARPLTEIAVEKGVVTQIGTQIHAGDNYRRVVELVKAGTIGKIEEVHVWCGASYGGLTTPTDTPPVPEYLDWDLWLGPAPYRPYHPAYVPFKWRCWYDFGSGALGDFFCHYCDLAFWALDLKYPTRVQADGPEPLPDSTPKELTVYYDFPARGQLPAVKLTWYDGGRRPPIQKEANLPNFGAGVLFVGESGMLLADYGNHVLWPQEKFADFQPPEPTIPSSVGHHREWVQGCLEGTPTTCPFSYSGPLSEAALLGLAAYRAQETLEWDGPNMRVVNTTAADRYIRKEYREGWTL
ncbi:Gfo/Idh/MocA family oxidoreductase [Thermostilla marina]